MFRANHNDARVVMLRAPVYRLSRRRLLCGFVAVAGALLFGSLVSARRAESQKPAVPQLPVQPLGAQIVQDGNEPELRVDGIPFLSMAPSLIIFGFRQSCGPARTSPICNAMWLIFARHLREAG